MFAKIFKVLSGDLFGGLKDLISEAIPDVDKRDALLAKMQETKMQFEVGMHQAMSANWQADMKSDSTLSKNIRPLMWLGTGVNLLIQFGLDSLMKIYNCSEVFNVVPICVGVSGTVMDASIYAFLTVSGLYIPAREIGKGIINWKVK